MPSKSRLNLYLGDAQRRHLEAVAERYSINIAEANRRIIDADAERERREQQQRPRAEARESQEKTS